MTDDPRADLLADPLVRRAAAVLDLDPERDGLEVAPLHGGQVGRVLRLTWRRGGRAVAKGPAAGGEAGADPGDPPDPHDLRLEARMLRHLRRESELPLPEVLHAERDLLLLEFLPGTPWNGSGEGGAETVERHAAELLAALHATPRGRFGFPEDTLVGPFSQPNPETDHWGRFFAEQRLAYMAGVAHECGRLDAALFGRLETLAARLPAALDHAPTPALIHGDVWSGNVLVDGRRVSGLLDPACYHADAEVELAFIALFGTFGEVFFERYGELRGGIGEGFWQWRCGVYQLYPLLVHVALFGGGYVERVRGRVEVVEGGGWGS